MATIIPAVLNVAAIATHISAGSVSELLTQVENDLQLSDIAAVTDRQVLTDANDPVMFFVKRITTATIDFLINRPCQPDIDYNYPKTNWLFI